MEEPADCLESPRVLWAAALTLAAAVVAVLVVREIAVPVLHPSSAFLPLTVAPPVVDTILCTVVAIFVFIEIIGGPNPVRTSRRVATVSYFVVYTRPIIGASSMALSSFLLEKGRRKREPRFRVEAEPGISGLYATKRRSGDGAESRMSGRATSGDP